MINVSSLKKTNNREIILAWKYTLPHKYIQALANEKYKQKPSVVTSAWKANTQEAEAAESLKV